MPPDFPFALALASVTIATVFVIAFRAAKRRGRRPWAWASASLLLVPFVVLLQLRHRDRPSVAPDGLGWVSRYSWPVILVALYQIVRNEPLIMNSSDISFRISRVFAPVVADAIVFFCRIIDPYSANIDVLGDWVLVKGRFPFVPGDFATPSTWVALAAALLFGLAMIRRQPWSLLLAVAIGLIIGIVSDTIAGLEMLRRGPMLFPNGYTPLSIRVAAPLAVFWAVTIFVSWRTRLNADLTTAPASDATMGV